MLDRADSVAGVKAFDIGFPNDFLGADPHHGPPGPSPVAVQRGTLDYVQEKRAI